MSLGSYSFPPENRLHHPWEYRRLFGRAEVFRLSECTVFRVPNGLAVPRVGITIKVRPGSIMRNKIKRAIREGFRHRKGDFGAFDYNVVVTSARRLDFTYPARLQEAICEELLREKAD